MNTLGRTNVGWGTLLLAVVALITGFRPACAELFSSQGARPQLTEYQLKAAFLLNFTKFVDWPEAERVAAANTPFAICIYGDDPFGGALDQIIQGESVDGRRLIVRRLARSAPESCQVLFFGKSEPRMSHILSTLPGGVLTVGDSEQFLAEGGTIAFIVENRRVRFGINQRHARHAGLRISSKLLTLAKTVQR